MSGFQLGLQLALIVLAVLLIAYGVSSGGPLALELLIVGALLALADAILTIRVLVASKRARSS